MAEFYCPERCGWSFRVRELKANRVPIDRRQTLCWAGNAVFQIAARGVRDELHILREAQLAWHSDGGLREGAQLPAHVRNRGGCRSVRQLRAGPGAVVQVDAALARRD